MGKCQLTRSGVSPCVVATSATEATIQKTEVISRKNEVARLDFRGPFAPRMFSGACRLSDDPERLRIEFELRDFGVGVCAVRTFSHIFGRFSEARAECDAELRHETCDRPIYVGTVVSLRAGTDAVHVAGAFQGGANCPFRTQA